MSEKWTKGHFEEVARAIRQEVDVARMVMDEGSRDQVLTGNARIGVCRVLAYRFTELFTYKNTRFDGARFLKACGFDNE